LTAKVKFGKGLMAAAFAWFIFWALLGKSIRVTFWTAVGIWFVGFLFWLYGEGVPKPSDTMLKEIERYRRSWGFPRGEGKKKRRSE
jgi:hypothetical protein